MTPIRFLPLTKRSFFLFGSALALALMWSCDSPSSPNVTPARVSHFAGNDQTAIVGTAVEIPPAVTVTNAEGTPLSGVAVTYAVTVGDGFVSSGNATTDDQGVAVVGTWKLGTTPGTNELTAVASGQSATFTATGVPDTIPAQVSPTAGNGQTATAGTAVEIPPAVTVTSANGTPLPGVAVIFSVTAGGGSVTDAVTTTDDQGMAAVGTWTLGTTPGTNELTAVAAGLTATFLATGSEPTNLEGVFIFEFDNFNGDAALLRRDISDLDNLPGPCGIADTWDDCISSIALSEGWSAILYEFDGFQGDSLIVVTNILNLDNIGGITDWDNIVSSIIVRSPN